MDSVIKSESGLSDTINFQCGPYTDQEVIKLLYHLGKQIHCDNKKWWTNLTTGEKKERNVGEMLMLAVSELSEALEGHRKNLQYTHLPHRKMFEVELADTIIRILDMAYGLGYDVGTALVEKMCYNLNRDDHKIENRLKDGGKKY